ncbi:MAG: addiction module protein [Bacteroidia bacterium]|nr:addiction module protein [Bacteroidia bacterium]
MTVAQRKINLAQKVLQTKDLEVLKTIDLIFSQEESEKTTLTKAQKAELDKRLTDIENGTARFYSWSEAKKIIRHKTKKTS